MGSLGQTRAGDLDAAFDPAALNARETRLLQTALLYQTGYTGPADGRWQPEAQAALTRFARAEFAASAQNLHAATLVLGLITDVAAQHWRLTDLGGQTLALPEALLTGPLPEDGGLRWWQDAGSLTVLARETDPEMAAAWHGAAHLSNADPRDLVEVMGPDMMLTSGRMADGRIFLTRSDRNGATWSTLMLAADAPDLPLLNLIRLSVNDPDAMFWDLPGDGALERYVTAAAALVSKDLQTRATPEPEAEGPEATGTGFFVNASTLVTAEHVVAPCEAITTAEGTPLELLAIDPARDIAVLRSPVANPVWLTLSGHAAARLGQKIHAVGFPYYRIAGTSLHLTGGNVSSLADVNDDARFFSFSAPVQPGNSGGPLIDNRGRVAGLVVSRLSEQYIADTTGTIPQNINYALNAGEVAGFLERQGGISNDGGLPAFDMDDGAPADLSRAIIPIICH